MVLVSPLRPLKPGLKAEAHSRFLNETMFGCPLLSLAERILQLFDPEISVNEPIELDRELKDINRNRFVFLVEIESN